MSIFIIQEIKKMESLKKIIPYLFVFLCLQSYSQTTFHTIGTDVIHNSNSSYPAPYGNWFWGAKNQFLVRASELQAEGMSAGDIYSLSFDVFTAVSTSLDNFEVSMN